MILLQSPEEEVLRSPEREVKIRPRCLQRRGQRGPMKQDDQNIRPFEFCRVVCDKTIGVRLELPLAFELVETVVLQVEFFEAVVIEPVIVKAVVITIFVKIEIQIVLFKLVL